jgi:hypothetical protein
MTPSHTPQGKLDLASAKQVTPTPLPGEDLPPQTGAELRRIVSEAKAVTPTPIAAPDLPPHARAGLTLAKWLFIIISCFILLSVLFLIFSEYNRSQQVLTDYKALVNKDNPAGSPANIDILTKLIDQSKEEGKEFRDFCLKMVQTILLNALFPTLTALLGYIFATHEKEGEKSKSGQNK